jgi:hypothetical protein
MSQEQAWTLGEMAHALHAERLAEAKHDGLVKSVQGNQPSPRVLLANALRALAALLDGGAGVGAQTHRDRQLARAV